MPLMDNEKIEMKYTFASFNDRQCLGVSTVCCVELRLSGRIYLTSLNLKGESPA